MMPRRRRKPLKHVVEQPVDVDIRRRRGIAEELLDGNDFDAVIVRASAADLVEHLGRDPHVRSATRLAVGETLSTAWWEQMWIVQLDGHPWVQVVPFWRWSHTEWLAGSVPFSVWSFHYNDTGGASGYELWQEGRCRERLEADGERFGERRRRPTGGWWPQEKIHSFETTLENRASVDPAHDPRFLTTFLHEQDAYVARPGRETRRGASTVRFWPKEIMGIITDIWALGMSRPTNEAADRLEQSWRALLPKS